MVRYMDKERGRPSAVTPEIIEKLENAFMQGMTDEEACLLVGIGTSSLYRYCESHDDFRERKEALKKRPKMTSRNIIARVLNGETVKKEQLETAKWYLERKARDEFSTKTEGTVNISLLHDRERAFDEFTEELRKTWKD